MSTATAEKSPAKKQRPHQRLGDPLPPLEQPPAKFAHLTGRALYRALITDDEVWTLERVALEAGRSESTVGRWLSYYVKWVDGERERDDQTFIKPTYVKAIPTWKAGDVRAWLMRTKRMKRETGKFVPYTPKGRRKGIAEPGGRPSRGWVHKIGPKVLAEYRELVEPPVGTGTLKPKAARQELARRHQTSERAIIRWMQEGRDLENGIKPAPGSR